MYGMMKVFLLMAVLVCISKAHLNEPGDQCLCKRVWSTTPNRSEIKEVQIHRATSFCSKVEIVITTNDDRRFCMDPNTSKMKKLLNFFKKQRAATAKPTVFGSTAESTNTATSS